MSSDFNKDALLRSAKRINVSYFKEQQEDAINAIWQWWQSQSISFTLSGYAGTGKALLDDTKVLTINGWHSIGDIKVGDKVAVPTGGFYPVSAVYHHSDRPLYKITFKDGRSIICDENHLWQVRSKRLIQKYHESNGDYTRYSYTKTTKELYDELKKSVEVALEENVYRVVYTISVGIVEIDKEMKDYDTLIKYSDFALNEAKKKGL